MRVVQLERHEVDVTCPECRAAKLVKSAYCDWFKCPTCPGCFDGDTLLEVFDEILKDRRRVFGIVSIEVSQRRQEWRKRCQEIGLRLVRPLQRIAAEVAVVAMGGFEGEIGDSQKRASRALDRLNDESGGLE